MRTGPILVLVATLLAGALLFFMLVMPSQAQAASVRGLQGGVWRASLHSPGGELPFLMELASPAAPDARALQATLVNGRERIPVGVTLWEDGSVVFDLHYDAQILARADSSGSALSGEWIKRRGPDRWSRLPFQAQHGSTLRFPRATQASLGGGDVGSGGADAAGDAPSAPSVAGRWAVRFASDAEPAVGLFEQGPGDTLLGTFATTTGDYRHLEGLQEGRELRLSGFDGAHAFLFTARLEGDGSLAGDFWSAEDHHETWTARRDEAAALPDAFALVGWTDLPLGELVFPDLDGLAKSLDAPEFAGRARILEIFGSWCPNCHDASEELLRLSRKYGPQGLSIVGLAFERTGDLQRDATQVELFARRHGVTWPLLLAGTADKAQAAARVRLLDQVRAFPTTIFLHADGRVRAVHSGFSGPATGGEFRKQQAAFEALIEELLAEEPPAAEDESAGAGAGEAAGASRAGGGSSR